MMASAFWGIYRIESMVTLHYFNGIRTDFYDVFWAVFRQSMTEKKCKTIPKYNFDIFIMAPGDKVNESTTMV